MIISIGNQCETNDDTPWTVFMLTFQNVLCISHLMMSWVGLAAPQGVRDHLGASGASALPIGQCVGMVEVKGLAWDG